MLDLAAHRKDRTVAFVAALVLLLQSVLMSSALAARHADATLDAFGNILCVTGTDDGSMPDGPHDIPNCCTLGCGMGAGWGSAQPAGGHAAWPDRTAVLLAFPPIPAPVLARPNHEPGRARAPPMTA